MYKTGDILKNGYTVVISNDLAVIAVHENSQQFAVWSINKDGDTFWGHYFSFHEVIDENKDEAFESAVEAYRQKTY